MSRYTPLYHDPNTNTTGTVSADVEGGQVVSVSGDGTVATAGDADASAVGVAAHNAPDGSLVAILHGGVQNLVADGGIDAGDQVVCAADGAVRTYDPTEQGEEDTPDLIVGVALSDIADEATGPVAFNR